MVQSFSVSNLQIKIYYYHSRNLYIIFGFHVSFYINVVPMDIVNFYGKGRHQAAWWVRALYLWVGWTVGMRLCTLSMAESKFECRQRSPHFCICREIHVCRKQSTLCNIQALVIICLQYNIHFYILDSTVLANIIIIIT